MFELLGSKERGLTAALGFTLAQDRSLRAALLEAVGLLSDAPDVSLEAFGEHGDRTDVELVGEGVRFVIEAKHGWHIPTDEQLSTYADRNPDAILVLTHCTETVAEKLGLPASINGVPVVHWPWRHLLNLVRTQQRRGARWARELLTYLEANVATLQNIESNCVYCVALGPVRGLGGIHGRKYLDQDVYFHPQGEGYPKTPPNYVGFRWKGHLQSIRHIDDYAIVGDLREHEALGAATVTDEEAVARPHLVYRLGPHVGPFAPLPAGTNYRASRHWIFLDLLLTAPTIKDALQQTRARQKTIGKPLK